MEKCKEKYGVSKFSNINAITCYMNSILHILQHAPIFIEYITQAKFRNNIIKKIEEHKESNKEKLLSDFVIFELFKLFKISHENEDETYRPISFKNIIGTKNPIWNELNQQDSQEFCNFLLAQLEEEVGIKSEFIGGLFEKEYPNDNIQIILNNIIANKISMDSLAKDFSPLKRLFSGTYENNKICDYCNNKSMRYESFITLQLSIDNCNNIYQCFDKFISEEELDYNNTYMCDLCNIKNKGQSFSYLWRTPKILILHLKRFIFNNHGEVIKKNTDNIDYPIRNLDLSKYFNPISPYKNSSKYDLFGINIHQAIGCRTNTHIGHYVSVIKNINNYNWYLYNDDAEVLKVDDLQTSNAYMLFYYRFD